MAAYYRAAPEPPAVTEAHAAHTLAISVHIRNGDTAVSGTASGTARGGIKKLRYTLSADLMPMMGVVAKLPSGCAAVLIVTELAQDQQVLKFMRVFAQASQNRTAVRVLDKQLCNGPCAFHTLAQADVLVAVTSGFSYTAAMVTKDSTTLAFAGHGEDNTTEHGTTPAIGEEFKRWRKKMGRPAVTTPAQLGAALRARLPARCHHTRS